MHTPTFTIMSSCSWMCVPGEKPDPEQVFRLSSIQNTSMVPPPPPVSPAQNTSHRLDTVLMETPQDTLVPLIYSRNANEIFVVVLNSKKFVSAGVEPFEFRIFKWEKLIRFVSFLHWLLPHLTRDWLLTEQHSLHGLGCLPYSETE